MQFFARCGEKEAFVFEKNSDSTTNFRKRFYGIIVANRKTPLSNRLKRKIFAKAR